jgi:hypothetical protein
MVFLVPNPCGDDVDAVNDEVGTASLPTKEITGKFEET